MPGMLLQGSRSQTPAGTRLQGSSCPLGRAAALLGLQGVGQGQAHSGP